MRVSRSLYPNGQLLGSGVLKGCKGKNPCKVAWLPGLPELPLEKARTDGLYSIIKKSKAIQVVSVQAGGYLAAPALKATQNILQAHPDVNVIVSSGDQMIAGAYRAIKLAGIADGKSGRPARSSRERRADQEPLDRPADAEPDRTFRHEGEHRQVQA